MFTLYRPYFDDNPRAASFSGTDEDIKPLDCKNGASYREINTGLVYRFDEENKIWYKGMLKDD